MGKHNIILNTFRRPIDQRSRPNCLLCICSHLKQCKCIVERIITFHWNEKNERRVHELAIKNSSGQTDGPKKIGCHAGLKRNKSNARQYSKFPIPALNQFTVILRIFICTHFYSNDAFYIPRIWSIDVATEFCGKYGWK